MKIKLITIILISVVELFTTMPVLANDELGELPMEPSIPGRVEGTGSYFEIKDSGYLNISLQSSEEITISLESVPKTIILYIEASSAGFTALTIDSSTTLTIGALEPNRTYYKFEDSYKNETVFVSDGNGSYSWLQDLSPPHHIWVQEEQGNTIFIPDQCSIYGTWDPETSTCTLTQDLTESVEIITNDITLDCNGHSITGTGSGFGVYLNNKSGVTIKNCTVNHFTGGVYLLNSSNNNTLTNNTASENRWDGIRFDSASNNTLTNNTLSKNRFGIYNHSSSNTFTNNTLSENEFGLVLYYSPLNIITDNFFINDGLYIKGPSHSNTIENNMVNNKPLIYLENKSDYIVTENAGQIILVGCNNITIQNQNISHTDVGIELLRTNNSKIINNTVDSNQYGIYLELSYFNTLANNIAVANHHHGIYFDECSFNTLTNNTSSNNGTGISLFYFDYNTLTDNITNSNSYDGIVLAWSDNNTLINNSTSNNHEYGIFLHTSRRNILTKNTSISNEYGIRFYQSSNNKIYHNNFIDNLRQAYAWRGAGNLFDDGYPSGGNYWSDYIGVDLYSGLNQDELGSDGMGDTPYTFTGGEDKYPFMKESGWEIPERIRPDKAVELAKEVTEADYLKGGKGYDFDETRFIESQKIKDDGYYYWNWAKQKIDFGKGLDCSGLSFWSYNRAYYEDEIVNWGKCVLLLKDKECPIAYEGADDQYRYNSYGIEKEDLRPGDLLFFDVIKDKYDTVDHVAMYIGEDEIIHAEGVLFKKIVKENLETVLSRYEEYFKGFGRVKEAEKL